MQEADKRRLKEIIKKDEESTKRTTIILEKTEREFIESLIKEGKERGIKPLISKMLDIYKSMMVKDWRFPGEYYYGISRIAFVNVELLNILIQQIPTERWRTTGKQMGNALKVSLETTLGIQAAHQGNWRKVFERLKIQGFGDIYLKDKYILIKTPFIGNAELWAGILEDLLETVLTIKTTVPPLVFELKVKQDTR